MTYKTTPYRILIIGGGIGGLALALLLDKAGIACTVYEARAYAEGIGGGFNIAPNGMHVLDTLGLARPLLEAGTEAKQFIFRNGNGRVIAKIGGRNPMKYGFPCVSVSRATLHDLLSAEMQRNGIPVSYGKRLVNISNDAGGVSAFFEDGTSARGDILVGADGIHSRTRGILLPGVAGPSYTGMVGIGGLVSLSDIPSISREELEALNFVSGPSGFFGYCGGDKGWAMWWSRVESTAERGVDELRKWSLEEVKADMLERYGDYAGPAAGLIAHTQRHLVLNIADIPSLPVWHGGRVVLIGDAAHAVSPSSGQGASMALEDACCLARLLRDHRDEGSVAYDRVFRAFERERKDRVERVVAIGRRRGAGGTRKARSKRQGGALPTRLSEWMMGIFLPIFAKRDSDWLFRYRVEWN